MKQKVRNRILILLFGVVGLLCTSSTVFGGSHGSGNNGNDLINGKINNSVCISYTTQSGLTGHVCSGVSITYSGSQNTGENDYIIQKSQKTGGMTDYTQSDIDVESGEYILYKVEFASVTGSCRKAIVRDNLPQCVKYIESSITGVIGTPTMSSGGDYIEYSDFALNGTNTGYLYITGQIIADTEICQGKYEYINRGSFKCANPASRRKASSVTAIRKKGSSKVTFEKTGNKSEMIPGETGLVFTLKVKNEGPNAISDIYVEDVWPGNNDCIEYVGRTGNAEMVEYLGNYNWHYIGGNGTLRANKGFTFDIYAKIKNDSSCVGDYVNTGKLTYEGGKPMYADYPFTVVDGSTQYKVSIEKKVEPEIVSQGTNVTYTIQYSNVGKKPLNNYKIVDYRPEDKLIFNSSTPVLDETGYDNGLYTITWFFEGPLNPGQSGTIRINATVR